MRIVPRGKVTDIGVAKVGNLAGIRAHKFSFQRKQYLITYCTPVPAQGAIELLVIDCYQAGEHEHFYDELKRYLADRKITR
jgi:hypothetical protein